MGHGFGVTYLIVSTDFRHVMCRSQAPESGKVLLAALKGETWNAMPYESYGHCFAAVSIRAYNEV